MNIYPKIMFCEDCNQNVTAIVDSEGWVVCEVCDYPLMNSKVSVS